MAIDVIIPTLKSMPEMAVIVQKIKDTAALSPVVFATCQPLSAAGNRNYGLAHTSGDIVIMCDDDIEGFTLGWDSRLIMPLCEEDNIVMVSARLMKGNGEPAYMLSENYNMGAPYVESEKRELPTACIAFRRDSTRFDECFHGSGFEDNDYCKQLQLLYPRGKFVVNNFCRLIHRNEMKNQKGKFWEHNQTYYKNKWGLK